MSEAATTGYPEGVIFKWESEGTDPDFKDVFIEVSVDPEVPGAVIFTAGYCSNCGELSQPIQMPLGKVPDLVQALMRLPVVTQLKGHPVVAWFPSRQEAMEFAGLVKTALPGMKAVDL